MRYLKVRKALKLPFDNYGGKRWVEVFFADLEGNDIGEWTPSLIEMCKILRAIADCEEEKYPQHDGFKGRRKAAEIFFRAANATEVDWEALRIEFEIPDRRKARQLRFPTPTSEA